METIHPPEVSRFKGMGLNFNAKLIGVQEVDASRGETICQEVIGRLKQSVLNSKQHKQKIIVNVQLDGLRIYDLKSSVLMHHHTVDSISFIARDSGDPRAFSYIHCPSDSIFQLFAIKTEAAADALVLSLRDLFQAVYLQRKAEAESKKTEPNSRTVAENLSVKPSNGNAIPETSTAAAANENATSDAIYGTVQKQELAANNYQPNNELEISPTVPPKLFTPDEVSTTCQQPTLPSNDFFDLNFNPREGEQQSTTFATPNLGHGQGQAFENNFSPVGDLFGATALWAESNVNSQPMVAKPTMQPANQTTALGQLLTPLVVKQVASPIEKQANVQHTAATPRNLSATQVDWTGTSTVSKPEKMIFTTHDPFADLISQLEKVKAKPVKPAPSSSAQAAPPPPQSSAYQNGAFSNATPAQPQAPTNEYNASSPFEFDSSTSTKPQPASTNQNRDSSLLDFDLSTSSKPQQASTNQNNASLQLDFEPSVSLNPQPTNQNGASSLLDFDLSTSSKPQLESANQSGASSLLNVDSSTSLKPQPEPTNQNGASSLLDFDSSSALPKPVTPTPPPHTQANQDSTDVFGSLAQW